MPSYFFLIWLILFGGSLLNSQEIDRVSPNKLIEKIKKYDTEAIRELGHRRERSAVLHLRKIAEEPDEAPVTPVRRGHVDPADQKVALGIVGRNNAHLEAKIALARMGEEKYFQHFLRGLSSDDDLWKVRCIYYLGRIGDKKAVKKIIPFLSNNAFPKEKIDGKRPKQHHFYAGMPFSFEAARALDEILPDVSLKLKEGHPHSETTKDEWTAWWLQNGATFRD